MGFFSSIGNAIKGAAKAVGNVAKKAFPTVLSVVKNVVPFGGIAGTAIDVATRAIGGSGGQESNLTKEIKQQIQGPTDPLYGGCGYGSNTVRSASGVRRKVVIYQ